MQPLTTITVGNLLRAGARLWWTGRKDGIDRAIWMAARNYNDQRDDAIDLPKHLVDRVNAILAPAEPAQDAL